MILSKFYLLGARKRTIREFYLLEYKIKLKNALLNESNLNKNQPLHTSNQKTNDLIIPIGKIQLKLFRDSTESKLYANVLTILINQQFNFFSNSECVFCKLQLLTSSKKQISTKSSDTCNLDESSGLFYVNEAFTFESIDSDLISDLSIQIEVINNRDKQIIGKSNLILTADMFLNRPIEVEMFSHNVTETYFNNLSKSKPNIDVSVESLNSGSLNSRRRQLPQIPMEKQNRDKTSIDLVEKTRGIKMDMNSNRESNSISDSEASISHLNKQPKSNDTSNIKLNKKLDSPQLIDKYQSDMFKKNQNKLLDRSSNTNEDISVKQEQINEFESLALLNDHKYSDKEPNSYLMQRRTTCANSEEIKNKFAFKTNQINQPFSLENLPNHLYENFKAKSKTDQMSPMSNKEIQSEFENSNKNQSWTEIPNNISKEKPKILTNSNNIIDSNNGDSLYLNANKASSSPPQSSNLPASQSQTFLPNSQFSKPNANTNPPNTSGTKPEKLFSTRLLNQRTQNAVLNSTKINSQNAPNNGQINKNLNGFEGDSEGSDNTNLSKQNNSQTDLNKGANTTMKISNLAANEANRITTVNKNNSTTTTTTTTVINNLNDIKTDKSKLNPSQDKNDGTMSDSALTNQLNNLPETANKKRRPSMAKALVILGLSKKSNSASNLTNNKRFGFARSEEYGVTPELRNRNLSPSSGDSSNEDKKPKLWSGALKLPHEQAFNEFIENLGPGQKISRQVLGLPCLGEIKLKMSLDKQKLIIQILEVRKLKQKIGYRILPNIYIKFYMYNGSICTEKQKTSSQRRTLTPVYEETLRFESDYKNKILQITVWGDYGKLDRKVFMGIIQIVLDDCNLVEGVTGWYKLYPASSIITDFSSIASEADLSNAESGYSLASHKSVK